MRRSAYFCGMTFAAAVLLAAAVSPAAEAENEQAEAKKAAVDPSGTWRWEHDEEGETIKDVLKLNFDGKQVTGTYQGRRGPYDIAGGKMEQDRLTFEFAAVYNDRKITVKFVGTVKEDEVDGTVSMSTSDSSRDFPWKAQRRLEPTDVVGDWKLAIELPDGNVLSPELKLSLGDKQDEKQELKGEYASETADFEVSKIAVKDNQLRFTVSGEFNGSAITADYTVVPRGDKFAGKLAFDLGGQTGELDVTGKREVKKKRDE